MVFQLGIPTKHPKKAGKFSKILFQMDIRAKATILLPTQTILLPTNSLPTGTCNFLLSMSTFEKQLWIRRIRVSEVPGSRSSVARILDEQSSLLVFQTISNTSFFGRASTMANDLHRNKIINCVNKMNQRLVKSVLCNIDFVRFKTCW